MAGQRDLSSIGIRVGNIRVLGRLGEGGMGAVFFGQDEKLQRRVALKAIRADRRLDAVARARFLREARILSQLDDPRICRIYDYLESEMGDFLVLELIEGKSLRDALRAGLTRVKILDIAEQLASVLAVAHAKGVIHRDLKPDNVMVTTEGLVKVLDFGLAQSSDLPDTDRGHREIGTETVSRVEIVRDPGALAPGALLADAGLDDATHVLFERSSSETVLGTLGYMSPEQARGDRLTTASDLYSFGVLLQELLTDQPPYDRKLTPAVVLMMVSQAESRAPEGLDSDLTRLILDLKNPAASARPTAVDALARLREIRDRPRRRLRHGLVALGCLALALFGVKYMVDLRRERTAAIEARRETEQVLAMVLDIFEGADPENNLGREVTAREVVERAALRLHGELEEQPLARARLLTSISAIYRKLGMFDQATDLARQALLLRENNLPADDPAIADSLRLLAGLYWNQSRNDEAETLLLRCLGIRERSFGRDSLEVADALNELGKNYSDVGRHREAEDFYTRSLAIRQKLLPPDHAEIGSSLQNLGITATEVGRYAEAEKLFREALAIKEKRLGPEHPQVARILSNYGDCLMQQKRFGEAEPLLQRARAIWEKAMGPHHPLNAWALHRLANLYRHQGRLAEAVPLYQRALTIRRAALRPDHPLIAEVEADLARATPPVPAPPFKASTD